MQQNLRGELIRGKGLTKIYREGATELRALQGVDLDVRAGELTMLMGPSGSGKTTLLSILGCILRASEGRLEVLGEDVTAHCGGERCVGARRARLPRRKRQSTG